ncbi:hypothetical protein D3C72_2340400 [compost metagenome]
MLEGAPHRLTHKSVHHLGDVLAAQILGELGVMGDELLFIEGLVVGGPAAFCDLTDLGHRLEAVIRV